MEKEFEVLNEQKEVLKKWMQDIIEVRPDSVENVSVSMVMECTYKVFFVARLKKADETITTAEGNNFFEALWNLKEKLKSDYWFEVDDDDEEK